MLRSGKDAARNSIARAGVALLTAAVFASVHAVVTRADDVHAGNFAITNITADCDGTGSVSFTGAIPAGGFTLELMNKAPDNSGPFISTVPPTVITITSGSSPVAYTMPLANWSPPHYRVDSSFQTKSPSLNCEAIATNTPQSTVTRMATSTRQAGASATPTFTTTSTPPPGSTSTPTSQATSTTTASVTTSTPSNRAASPGSTEAVSGASPSPDTLVNTVLALERPRDVSRLPSALPNTGGSGGGWAGGDAARLLTVLAGALVAAALGWRVWRAAGDRRR